MDKINQIKEINKEIDNLEFKHSGIFANSLLKTQDTTQILRDIRDEELVFFQGKKILDIDYEFINNSGINSNDGFAQHEFYKLLEDEINLNLQDLNLKLPKNIELNNENFKDFELIKNIYKRTFTISKIWANPNSNMLDHESNQLLKNSKEDLKQLCDILNEISQFQDLIKKQRNQLNSSYQQDDQ
ncbi:hypothetical protein C6P40_001237 [Pichia californica]|uniref:Uncharacterized protein n=1 Tax=Pichia californica TaxID=460514 RepID=A0A9P6WRC8_9ASCO|nr:hypothetical protein C6P42_004407 [[Candida] californica]KAG0690803.1 hypothetical protein C6P40_001237 [[Candida] californica]